VAHHVSTEAIEAMVVDALDDVPDEFLAALDNVVILVEDHPPDGEDLLGLYEGIAVTEKSPWTDSFVLPDRITLYRVPLCDTAADHDDLVEWVRSTLYHELGHHFGLDEARLHELGWG